MISSIQPSILAFPITASAYLFCYDLKTRTSPVRLRPSKKPNPETEARRRLAANRSPKSAARELGTTSLSRACATGPRAAATSSTPSAAAASAASPC